MAEISIPEIPWDSPSTQAQWQEDLDRFGYIVIELNLAVEVPYYFRREGWDHVLKIIATSSLEEFLSQRSFNGIRKPYHPLGNGNFYRLVAE